MAWLYLVLAGICEIGWPLGLKLGWTDSGARPSWIIFAVVAMTASGALLLWAQRFIPMGTAYAVWTGIGAVGAFVVGILAFGDQVSAMRMVSIGLIVAGIVGLKLAWGVERENPMRMKEKVALGTGAASGMGAATARLFAREGAKAVFVADMLDKEGAAVVAEIAKAGGKAVFIHLDVTDEKQWTAAIDKIMAGEGRLDVLVNNA